MALSGLKKRLKLGGGKLPSEIKLINEIESELKPLSDADLKNESVKLRDLLRGGENLDKSLPRAFALIREVSRRTLGQRHYDVQLWGGVVLHKGGIAEMKTGEGKTLASTAPIYLNALPGEGVHVVTVNEYLAKRDTVWMGEIYNFLGLSVSCLIHDGAFAYDPEWKMSEEERKKADEERDIKGSFEIKEDFLRPISRREAYAADITYGTNHEFGFDYLRDNLAQDKSLQVQRGLNYAIIDEVDSILIDEARTPLIISSPDRGSADYYKVFTRAVERLEKDADYIVDEKLKAVEILEPGIDKVEKATSITDLYSVENLRLAHYLEASLKAKALFEKDREYVVKDGEIIIVDQFTGRLMYGRRYSAGLHQALEAKEGIKVNEESKTVAQVSIQNYFRLYKKIAGMTGTAKTSAEEFFKVYGIEVTEIPTNEPVAREDMSDAIFKTLEDKYKAIIEDVRKRNEAGQPVLLGTVSIDKNEMLSRMLGDAGITHEVLNAKHNEHEGSVIAQAGRPNAVTVATNLAGRGVDIILGGNPGSPEGAAKVREAGGLHVIGTERHEARRIDNQLRGRAGRQGDPGSSQFFLSMEDDLMRIFGGDRVKGMMDRLPEGTPIENKMVSKAISSAQSRVEGFNFDARKHLLEYDDILNKQRTVFYRKRQEVMDAVNSEGDKFIKNPEKIREIVSESVGNALSQLESGSIKTEDLHKIFEQAGIPHEIAEKADVSEIRKFTEEKIKNLSDMLLKALGTQFLAVLNMLWMNHLEDIEAIMESVRIRAYGQRDPLVEYRRESKIFFDRIEVHFNEWVFGNVFRVRELTKEEADDRRKSIERSSPKFKDVGRNDPCPCGSGKKYKKCHGA
ncbi:MAG: Protein translocase subunit SecA [Parcubacteria group bacterium GW2011_GWB1_45_7]|uniref:Protein translocase subunit SecA n=2 Tax=Candidatus Colwelliibacteriota TaxID=1817904 RepID=A0A1G1ZFQ6_9BACT|nr:MAG: Protein translocase subunit SecA [Parcubacteria group bacterium GW2011_GWB1_45_7]OGY58432.1 MAG: preprotein translocase subunit SecA [Candidatus Colwellbacteria bacterium RIFCSPHIGHO2_02_FULL_45_17]OGY60683.1 MAG: preprotein translocase subunit SecA [Candidatus Colwellbacteria bacterium RIFCSPLOWO2_02_FULL_45_11]OGY62667.1 MAG: preprotein translocase subunit SecA [Candidatus Colwellbacteria bacterium RIFCSPLOWO2_12_FULL_46_17]